MEVAEPRTETTDRVIWRCDLPGLFMVSDETIRRWLKGGKLPKPDVDLTRVSKGWRMSTLRAAGINLP